MLWPLHWMPSVPPEPASKSRTLGPSSALTVVCRVYLTRVILCRVIVISCCPVSKVTMVPWIFVGGNPSVSSAPISTGIVPSFANTTTPSADALCEEAERFKI
jgi:hypothetical protein